MSVLVVGISHKTAPVAVLERLALDRDSLAALISEVSASDHVSEATAIATCNRLEIYADVDRFHGSVEEVSRLLVQRAGTLDDDLLRHLYVHYDDAAVSHLFSVAAGLDSMVVGEGQILGQTREALRVGQELGSVGPSLNTLFQQALRVGKRAHAETDIDGAAPSLVTAALAQTPHGVDVVAGKHVVVVGAGSMAGLATATVARRGAGSVVVVNRTFDKGQRLASEYGASAASLDDLPEQLSRADLLITCAGAAGHLVTVENLSQARAHNSSPLAVIDLALPHDVDPAVTELPGVTLVALATLAEDLRGDGAMAEVDGVREIVTQEIAAFVAARRVSAVTPTVVALRSMATSVVDAELTRLDSRLPGLDAATRAELVHTVRRVADKLLHQPTVRVKELAEGQTVSYATALAELFALDPEAVDAVTRPAVAERLLDAADVVEAD